jgi:hypothetical protein
VPLVIVIEEAAIEEEAVGVVEDRKDGLLSVVDSLGEGDSEGGGDCADDRGQSGVWSVTSTYGSTPIPLSIVSSPLASRGRGSC